MGIMIRSSKGQYAPLVICDVCSKPIIDSGLAGVTHSLSRSEEEEFFAIRYAHKGVCLDSILDDPDNDDGWEELDAHLLQVLHNVGLVGEDMEKARLLFNFRQEHNF